MEKKNIFRKLFLGLSILSILGMGWACVDEDAPENWAPGFQTINSENVMRTTATLVGQLSGSVNLVKEYGFQYSESSNFPADKTDNVLVGEGAPTGSFHADIFDLEPNQRYYYRVYASTKSTTVYSETNNFDTPSSSAPTLSFISVDSIGENYIRITCRVDDIGDEYLLEYGVGYKTKDESSYTPVAASGFVDEIQRTFVVEVKNLEPSTVYTFRPYAKNSLDAAGNNGVREGYGDTFEERTEELLSPDVDTSVATAGISSVKVSGVVNSADGSNGELLDCGFVWSSTNEEPRLELNDDYTLLQAPERLEEYFDYTITGLTPSTTYYVCAFARNKVGEETRIGYGKVMSFTTGTLVRPNLNIESYERDATSITIEAIIANFDEGALSEKGFIYSRTNADVTLEEATVANAVLKVSAGAKQFNGTINDLTMNTSYFVRAYAVYKAENVDPVVGYSSAYEISTSDFQTPGIDLEINQESITRKSVELVGKISSQGNGTITERGFVLIPSNITSEPTLEHTEVIKVIADEGFVSVVDGLEYSMNYAVRSYVTSKLADKVKTVYSGTMIFGTKAVEMPRFNNVNVSDVTYDAFKISCGIVNIGDGILLEKGFCWKKNKSDFTLADCTDSEMKKIDTEDISSFEHTVTGIQSNSNYYVRAYAKVNVDGTEMIAYTSSAHVGSQSFDLPGLETPVVNSETLTRNSADLEAVLYNEGNGTISEKGFVLSLTSKTYEPTLNNCLLKVEADADFKATAKDLTPNTEYAVQAFVVVNWGEVKKDTVYSNWRATFYTKPIVTSTFNNVQLEDATYHSVKVTCGVSEMGDGTFIEKGFFWKRNSTDFNEGKDSIIVVSENHNEFSQVIDGLESESWYYIGAYTKSDVDGKMVISTSGWGEVWISSPSMPTFENFKLDNSGYKTLSASIAITNQGHGEILEKGFCWSLVENEWKEPTLDNNLGSIAVEGAIDGFSTQIKDLQVNKEYGVRAYAKVKLANKEVVAYSSCHTIIVNDTNSPSLNFQVDVLSTTRNSAEVKTGIENMGNGTITHRGFVISLTTKTYDPIIGNCEKYWDDVDESFTMNITGLKHNTEYAVRAFVVSKWEETCDTVYSPWRNTFRTNAVVTSTFNNVELSDVTYHSVKATSSVVTMCEGTFIEKGFIYWYDDYQNRDSVVVTSDSHMDYSTVIDGLQSDRSYNVSAYTKSNVDGIDIISSSSANSVWIPGPDMPYFENFNVNEEGYRKARLTATIILKGDGEVTETGFCWNLQSEEGEWTSPTLEQNTGSVKVDGGLENYTALLEDLTLSRTYYLRAYAKVKVSNGERIVYSGDYRYEVNGPILPNLNYSPEVPYERLTRNSAEVKANIDNVGNGEITHRGFVLSLVSNTNHPTIENCDKHWDNIDETFALNITELEHDTEYAVRGFVVSKWEEAKDTIYNESATTFRTRSVVTSTFNNVELTDITYHSVKAASGVAVMGEGTFVEKGFYWRRNDSDFSQGKDSIIVVSDDHNEFSQVIDGLESDSWYYVGAYTKTNVDGKDVISASGWSRVWISGPGMPSIENFGVVEAGYRAVRPTATVVMQEDGELIESGFCWNLLPTEGEWREPTLEENTGSVKMEGDLTNLDTVLKDLIPSRSYYIRAYAKVLMANGERIAYTHNLQFEVQGANRPTLSWSPDINWDKVTRNSAEVKTNIDYVGNGEITHRGFVLALTSKTTEPTIENSDMKWDDVDETFTKTITGLEYNTEYIVRGFVVAKWEEELDTVYNNASSTFRTLEAVMPTFTRLAFGNQGLNTFTVSSEITAMGDGTLKEKGFCWNRVTSDFNLNTETTVSKVVEGDALTLTVDDLEPNTRYYVKAYAKVDVDGNEMVGYSGWSEVQTTAYNHPSVNNPSVDNEQVTRTSAYLTATLSNQGNGTITERGFVLSLTSVTQEPTLENNVVKVVADENFTATATGLTWNTDYAVRAYIISKWEDSGFEETVYSGWRSTFRTDNVVVPTFNNIGSLGVTYSSVKLQCGIASLGDAAAEDLVEKGFLWSENYDPTLDNCVGSKKVEGGTNEEFADSIGGLVPGRYYYGRAYAKVKVDGNEVIGYSGQLHFRTASFNHSFGVTPSAKSCDINLSFSEEAENVGSAYLYWSTDNEELNAGNGTKFDLTKDETTFAFSGTLGDLTHDTTYYYKVYYVYEGNEIELRSGSFHTKRLPQQNDNVSPDKKE